MANKKCKLNLRDGISSTNRFKRNNYFKGKLLSAQDFLDEQDYLTDKVRRLSQLSNGSGVIEGLRVNQTIKNKDSKISTHSVSAVILTAGAAIDTQGNLLFLNEPRIFNLTRTLEKGDFIYLKYLERGDEKVSLQNEEECDDECCFNKIEEDFEIYLDKELLTSQIRTICTTKEKKTLSSTPLVLIGQYNLKGGIDYSNVKNLYKNSELSKRLCEISKKYVSSVNGKTGDITTISSINNAVSDNEGQVNLIAGNNISVTSEGHEITIASKNGYYHDYYITIEANKTCTIKHNAKRFPSVDIYLRSNFIESYTAEKDTDIKQQARDSRRSYDDIKLEKEALSLHEHILRLEQDGKSTSKETDNIVTSVNSLTKGNISMGEALFNNMSINSFSQSLLKISDRALSKMIEHILITPNYQYTKVVGTQDPKINVSVTHLNRNTLRLKNSDTKNSVSLLVVLNT